MGEDTQTQNGIDKACDKYDDLTERAMTTRAKVYEEKKWIRLDLAHLFGEYEQARKDKEKAKIEQAEQEEYEAINKEARRLEAIRKTQQALRDKEDTQLSGQEIVNLANSLHIEIPLRTRGWILNNLNRYNPQTNSYRHKGGNSKSF